ncbi:DUF4193 domain-containing protein [Streptomyces sp. NPDC057623]|uniref:DUF4193 domain-containing protein n=1 Tax=Streptomyces sp. NPDC057623 TaxID=3346187 RepID=UPI0036922D50
MATDFDAPRNDGVNSDDLDEFKTGRDPKTTTALDINEFEIEGLELPGADLSKEELAIQVLPATEDEFICASCFLVHHRSQVAARGGRAPICRDCDDA